VSTLNGSAGSHLLLFLVYSCSYVIVPTIGLLIALLDYADASFLTVADHQFSYVPKDYIRNHAFDPISIPYRLARGATLIYSIWTLHLVLSNMGATVSKAEPAQASGCPVPEHVRSSYAVCSKCCSVEGPFSCL
jgi:hypothetical protein